MSTSASASTSDAPARPVIVITGANSGVGFGLAQRLLVQLSSPTPSDTIPVHPHKIPREEKPLASPFSAPDGCTLILACRNAIKAHRARAQLVNLLCHLEELPDDAEPLLSVPRHVLEHTLEAKANGGSIDEDADPALVAQAMEASLRRRRRRSAAISHAELENAQERDLTRDPRTGRTYSMREREIRARGRYRRRFCAGTKIEIQAIDLGSMASALQCAKEITARHRYVTHVILNAGSSAFTGINWPHAIWMVLTSFHAAVTYPAYKLQRAGDVGKDGYGWVWQANVGAHYILVRALLPALRATPYSTPSRIIWTGSLEASEQAYDPSDFQCVDAKKSPLPYESAKYQCELAAHGLEDVLQKRQIRTEPGTPLPFVEADSVKSYADLRGSAASSIHGRDGVEPKSFLAHPGVVASSIFAECLNVFLAACMHLAFYIARWTFSDHHNIEAYKGAVAASHVALAPLSHLNASARYGAQTDWHGREYVFVGRTPAWDAVEPKGRGREAKSKILAGAIHQTGKPRAGEYVQALSRDLIVKCERVAKQVWTQAQEGALPPFGGAELDEDVEDAKEGANQANALLSAQLLPKKRNGNAAIATKDKPLPSPNKSTSTQDSWEKVDNSF